MKGRGSGVLLSAAALASVALASAAPPSTKPAASPPASHASSHTSSHASEKAHGAPADGGLPMLPSIARVKLSPRGDQVVVTEDVVLPRGDWKGEALDLYVAFGAPGVPRAIDAHLLAVGDGLLEPDDGDAGDSLAIERVPRRPATAYPLLGRDAMAGVVVHVTRAAMARALAPGDMAALRVRTAIDLALDDPQGGNSVLVRLGASRGTPLTLGRVVVDARGVTRAEATLCGPEADRHPLAIGGLRKAAVRDAEQPLAPVLAVRHATDDLCVRLSRP